MVDRDPSVAAADTGDDSSESDQSESADRVVLSYRSPAADPDGRAGWVFEDSDWAREELNDPSYREFLRRTHTGPVSVGDEFEEFVSTGCGGRTDVILRVERVEGGGAIGLDTGIESVPRRSIVE